jgi:hypothetical protein
MNFKTTYVLFAILAVVLAVFGLTQLLNLQNTKDQTLYALPSLHDKKKPVHSEDIETVEIERNRPQAEKLVFYRTDQGWRLKQPNVRIDGYLVDRVIQQVIDARKEEKADVSPNLKQLGLDEPAIVVTLIKKGGEPEWKLNVGNESVTGGAFDKVVYVTSTDRPKEPLAVKQTEVDTLFKNVNEFRSKSLLAASAFDIVAVKLEEPKRDPVALEKAADNRWRFEKPAYGEAEYEGETSSPGENTAKRISGVRDLLQAVADIRVESDQDFATNEAKDTELTEKGLEKGKETIRIEVKRQNSLAGSEKKEPVQDALLIGTKADDKGEKRYARLESDSNIVKVPAKKVDEVIKVFENPAALRNRDLVQVDKDRVDALDIKLSDRDLFKLRRVGDPVPAWKIYDAGKVQEGESSAVQGLLTALTNKRQIKEFVEASKTDADLGLDRPAVVLSLWTDGIKKEEKKEEKKDEKAKEEKKDEKKDDKAKEEKEDTKADAAKAEEKKDAEPKLKEGKPTVQLAFSKKDKDLVYVRREVGNDVSRVAVAASLLDKVSEGKIAYLDRKLPSFASNAEPAKVVILRGRETVEVDREKKDDKSPAVWKIQQPKEQAGRRAEFTKVNNIVHEMRDLLADKLVTEKATNNELERFGLTAPSYKVTITLPKEDKKTEEHVYLFGKETDDKTGVYAKQGGHDLVFVVKKNVLDGLQGDLQDPTVFSLDPAKVKGLKLIGWQDIIGSSFALDLERKSSQDWAVKAPPDFKVDSRKAESLLQALQNLRAEKFIAHKIEAKPEYKFEPKDGALEIVLTVEGEKDPYTLTVGGLSGSDGYYAKSNKLPDDVFVVRKEPFEQVKSKPAYFKPE